MNPIEFTLATVALVACGLAYWCAYSLNIRTGQLAEERRENDRLERALNAERAKVVRQTLRADLAAVTAGIAKRAKDDAEVRHSHMLLDLDLRSRLLPDIEDVADLVVPSWPIGDSPIYDAVRVAVA